MNSIFRKPAIERELNGLKIHIRPLGMDVLLSLDALKQPVAEAIAKFKSIGINDYESTKHTTPVPSEKDPEAIEYTERTKHAAPSPAAVTQVLNNRAQAIQALFDCIFQEKLIAKIFTSSVEELKGLTHEELFTDGVDSKFSMDVPTAVEILAFIIEANKGGFESLGKSLSPLFNTLKEVGLSS